MNKYACIYPNKDGKTFDVKTKAVTKDGVVKYITKRGFTSKADALKYKNDRIYEISNSFSLSENGELTLYGFLNDYRENYMLNHKTDNSLKTYINKLKTYIADCDLKYLKPIEFRRFQETLAVENLSSTYKNALNKCLLKALHNAVRRGLLDFQLYNAIEAEFKVFKGTKEAKTDYYTLEEFERFIDTFEASDPMQYLFLTLFYSGCRIAELRAIFLEDIDFNNNTIRIWKQHGIVHGYTKEFLRYNTKTNKNRLVVLPQEVMEKLKHYVSVFKPTSYLFYGQNQTQSISPERIARSRQQHATMAGLKIIRNHDFRHSITINMIDNGVDYKTVAQQLGHTNVSTTMNTYDHVTQKRQEVLQNVLNKLYNSKSNSQP